MSVDAYFVDRPTWERPIFEAIREHLEMVGDVRIEAVSVGVFFKRSYTFAELRPQRQRLVLSLLLSRRFKHDRIARSLHASGLRSAYFIHLRAPADLDDEVRDWLTEAYLTSPT
jgi:hypothetical protein